LTADDTPSCRVDRVHPVLHVASPERRRGSNRAEPDGSLAAYNGTAIPNVRVETTPTLDASAAAAVARRHLAILHSVPELEVETNPPTLVVYSRGLGTGRNDTMHLTWEVEVSHHSGQRAFVFVDAHDGSIVDRLLGTSSAVDRRSR